jgi:formyl-CoA transferase
MPDFDALSGDGPLAGVVVIEAGTMISSGSLGRLLSDFGATVIKVEHPEYDDPLRDLQPRKEGHGLWWKYLSRNKKTITLNLSEERGKTVFEDLASEADVVIENFRPGTFDRWGLGYDDLSEINDGLVMLSISGYGQSGPYSKKPGFGTLAESLSGFAHLNGFPDSPPLLPKTGFADNIAALYSAFAIMYALYNRDVNGGSGQHIDVSLLEPLFNILGPEPLQYDQLGEIPKRSGNQSSISAPRNVYRTGDDRYIALPASTQNVAMRCFEAIDRPDLKDDPRFSDNEKRVDNADELDEIIQDWIGEHSREDVVEHFEEYDVPVAPVYNIRDILNDEHFEARESVISVDDEELGGEARVQNVFPKFSETPGEVDYLGPPKGEYNEEVYGEILDYDEQLRAELEEDGII